MSNRILLIILLLAFLAHLQLKSQHTGPVTGQLEIIQDSRVDSLLARHIWLNQYHQVLDGYRIQIFFDAGNNSRSNAYKVKDEFLGISPDSTISVYITFKEPYYRVRVGDFRTRLDAEGFLQLIKPSYPNAFPIKEQINLPKI
jgi:hypothetical protein